MELSELTPKSLVPTMLQSLTAWRAVQKYANAVMLTKERKRQAQGRRIDVAVDVDGREDSHASGTLVQQSETS